MSEQPMHNEPTNPYPYPYPYPYQYGAPMPPPPPSAPPRRKGPVIAAVGTALAVVVGAGAAGFALGRSHQDQNQAGGSFQNQQGQQTLPEQGGSSPFQGIPANPFGGQQFGGAPQGNAGNGAKATSDQISGLVRVASTLKYQGGEAAGTGLIMTSDGEVITNNHVVEGATSVSVKVMSTGRTYSATVVGTDPTDDVAVLQLQGASGLSTVTTDTSGVGPGDKVVAVGDAGGSTDTFTAATGSVTHTGQNITTHSEDGSSAEHLKGLLEISSDVISGDSGGATYNSAGQVVGMTTAASSGSSDVVGYAIPISTVTSIAGDLENHVTDTRYVYQSPAFLGLGLGSNGTVVEGAFSGTPAAEAGIGQGDRITAIGSTQVSTAKGLKAAVTKYSPGDQVSVTWVDQAGTSHTATVTLIAGPVA